jgi:hypothetical protein
MSASLIKIERRTAMLVFYTAKMRRGSEKVKFSAATVDALKSGIAKLINLGYELIEVITL